MPSGGGDKLQHTKRLFSECSDFSRFECESLAIILVHLSGDGPEVQRDWVGVCVWRGGGGVVGRLGCGLVLLYSIFNRLYSIFYRLYSIFYFLVGICLNRSFRIYKREKTHALLRLVNVVSPFLYTCHSGGAHSRCPHKWFVTYSLKKGKRVEKNHQPCHCAVALFW